MSDCLFCAIVQGEIPADVVLRTDRVLAFRDIEPKAPVHVLVIPLDHHPDVPAAALADPRLGAELLEAAARVAASEGVADSGYRLVANTGRDGGQSVHHAHLHVLGGRGLTWPPG